MMEFQDHRRFTGNVGRAKYQRMPTMAVLRKGTTSEFQRAEASLGPTPALTTAEPPSCAAARSPYASAAADAVSPAATVSAPRLALHLASAAASDQASSRVPPHEESMSPIG